MTEDIGSEEVLPEELLIETIARLIGPARHVAVGSTSPIPGGAALLARHRQGSSLRISVLQSRKHNFFTDGGRELFDCAGQGRIDVFFLSGGEIDGGANINLVGTGSYPRSSVRFPGSFGSAYLYFVIPRVILFREEHSRRTLVDRVAFISAPGTSPPNVFRPGGPVALVTGRCVFSFDRNRARFTLASLHPGHTLEEIRDETGFDFDVPSEISVTQLPNAATLAVLRGPIARDIAETYPSFAERVFGLGIA